MSVRLPLVGHEQAVTIIVDMNQESRVSVPRELPGEVDHLDELREYSPEDVIEVANVAALQKMPEIKRIIKNKTKKEVFGT